jgi:WD40 repeat protein
MAASPAAGVVAAGQYQAVELRDAAGRELLAQWDAHEKTVNALAFSPDGRRLVTGGSEKVVKVWDVSGVAAVKGNPNARALLRMPELAAYEWPTGPVRAVAVSPDGSTAAAVGDRLKFVVWDLD